MEPYVVRVRMKHNRCPLDSKQAEKKPKNGLPSHLLVYSSPDSEVDWETGGSGCAGPFWRVHESSVKAAFGRYYDRCPPVFVCPHQIEAD
ncbi:MAG: hypothetical protein ACRD4T_11900 [Candidatus Acidiferrales bacterium]